MFFVPIWDVKYISNISNTSISQDSTMYYNHRNRTHFSFPGTDLCYTKLSSIHVKTFLDFLMKLILAPSLVSPGVPLHFWMITEMSRTRRMRRRTEKSVVKVNHLCCPYVLHHYWLPTHKQILLIGSRQTFTRMCRGKLPRAERRQVVGTAGKTLLTPLSSYSQSQSSACSPLQLTRWNSILKGLSTFDDDLLIIQTLAIYFYQITGIRPNLLSVNFSNQFPSSDKFQIFTF